MLRKLTRNWKIAVEQSVAALLSASHSHPDIVGALPEGIRWAIGFIDYPETEALCRDKGKHDHDDYGEFYILLFNPIFFAKERYRRGDPHSYFVHRRILALAIHEASHIVEMEHSRRFIDIMFEVDACIDKRAYYRRFAIPASDWKRYKSNLDPADVHFGFAPDLAAYGRYRLDRLCR